MTNEQKIMLPAAMPTVAVGAGGVTWFPNGVFGEWQEFDDLITCLKTVGDGMYVICSTLNGEFRREVNKE